MSVFQDLSKADRPVEDEERDSIGVCVCALRKHGHDYDSQVEPK